VVTTILHRRSTLTQVRLFRYHYGEVANHMSGFAQPLIG
jgi:hypothetical protein